MKWWLIGLRPSPLWSNIITKANLISAIKHLVNLWLKWKQSLMDSASHTLDTGEMIIRYGRCFLFYQNIPAPLGLVLHICRDHSGHGRSQWEMTLQCNVASHWVSPYLEWSLYVHSWKQLLLVISLATHLYAGIAKPCIPFIAPGGDYRKSPSESGTHRISLWKEMFTDTSYDDDLL